MDALFAQVESQNMDTNFDGGAKKRRGYKKEKKCKSGKHRSFRTRSGRIRRSSTGAPVSVCVKHSWRGPSRKHSHRPGMLYRPRRAQRSKCRSGYHKSGSGCRKNA